MKFSRLVFSLCAFVACVCFSCESTDLNTIISTLAGTEKSGSSSVFTNSEAISAMKDALLEGITASSSTLSASDGYFGNAAIKILLPDEAGVMLEYIDKIPGGSSLVDDVVLRLNRSAEKAASEVVPIFSTAIKDMSVTDGISIVCGDDDAATEYLRDKTYSQLMDLYQPKVAAALSEPLVLGVSADDAWTNLVTAYNKVAAPVNKAAAIVGKDAPMPEVEVDLASYATGKALDGLFLKVAEEELEIRANPLDYASSMIQKVFGAVKQGLVP